LRRTIWLVLAAAIASLIATSVATAATGTWSQYPNGGTEYQAQVQQPINNANTSNWSSKSKGAIPVMFKLSSRTAAAAFESISGDSSSANDYAYATFTPDAPLTFAGIDTLKANYDFTLGDCHGGALRWEVQTNTGGLFIYYGDEPNTTDCTTHSQSGTNMVGLNDLRYDTSAYPGGSFYDTYIHALELMGSDPIRYVAFVLDGGWGGNQRAAVSNITVNDSVYQFRTGGSDWASTCNLPPATIAVSKLDPVEDGSINEEPVQGSLADSGNSFRNIDCKYQYNLSVPSLKGAGTYQAKILVDGTEVPTPASPNGKVKFDLK
jgi:hypothetical protein